MDKEYRFVRILLYFALCFCFFNINDHLFVVDPRIDQHYIPLQQLPVNLAALDRFRAIKQRTKFLNGHLSNNLNRVQWN